MSLPIYQRVAVTDTGDVIPGAEYTVIYENTGVAAPIYSDRTGATLLSAPYFADSVGTIQFFIAAGTTFRVAASGGVGTYTDRYIYAAHPQSSRTDTTADSLMAVGAFGLGATAPLVTDLNAIQSVSGLVCAGPTAIGVPPATGSWSVTSQFQAPGYGTQLAINRDFGHVYVRYCGAGVWSTWKEIITANAAGNVGIGTGTAGQKLHVTGGVQIDGNISTPASGQEGLLLDYYGTTARYWSRGDATTRGSHSFNLVESDGQNQITAMTIDSSGSVGIGTSSPTFKLDVAGNARASYFAIRTNEAVPTESAFMYRPSTGALGFGTSGFERMRIDSSGNLLVGTTDAAVGVGNTNIGHSLGATGYAAHSRAGTALYLNRTVSDGEICRFQKSGVAVGGISVNASATAYNTSSDYRLKEDDVAMTGATERVKALRPVNFAWKVDGSRVDGFFAHELAEVVPEASTGAKDAMMDEEYEVTPAVYEDVTTPAAEAVLDEDGLVITEAVEESTESILVTEAVMGTRSVPDYQGIDQSKLVPLLTATIQELIARIEILEAK